jgi:hypothetical protein
MVWMIRALALGCVFALACAGANGDPAPQPIEAGADVAVAPCTDAGSSE